MSLSDENKLFCLYLYIYERDKLSWYCSWLAEEKCNWGVGIEA